MLKRKRVRQSMKPFVFILLLMCVLSGASIDARSDDFTIIVLPDTQLYPCKHWALLDEQINWIVNSRDAWNIVYVAHVGDIVECGNTIYDIWLDPNWNTWRGCSMFEPAECTGHWPIPDEPYPDDKFREWKIVDDVFSKLEDPLPEFPYGIPYGLAIGNHDQFIPWNPYGDTTSSYNAYFGVDRFEGRPYYGGSYEENNNDNHYDIFTAGGIEFIVIYIEHNKYLVATTPVLDWVDGLLDANPRKKGIIVLHDMLSDPDNCDQYGGWRGRGKIVFDKLKHNTNLYMMLCGHVGDGQSYRVDYPNGQDGNVVYTILSDYQARGSEMPDSLGGGYLRIMKFSPSNNRIYIKSYSPFQNSWLTDCANEFELPLTNNYVHMKSPNGGEYWRLGTTQTITWTASDLTNTVKITLWKDGAVAGVIASGLDPTAGSYTWTVGKIATGSVTAGSGYTIKIKEKGTVINDFSDAPFTICDLTLTSPNGGETWDIGTTQNITWTSSDITGTVKITLWDSGGNKVGNIKSAIDISLGTYSWTVGTHSAGTAPAGTGYTIKIKLYGEAITDKSDGGFTLN